MGFYVLWFTSFRDCIKGVGWNILKDAFEILGRIDEDEIEVTGQMVDCCCIFQETWDSFLYEFYLGSANVDVQLLAQGITLCFSLSFYVRSPLFLKVTKIYNTEKILLKDTAFFPNTDCQN